MAFRRRRGQTSSSTGGDPPKSPIPNLVFVVLLPDPDDAAGLARLLDDVKLPERSRATFVAPPVRGSAFFAWPAPVSQEWRDENIPAGALPVYLLEHEPGLAAAVADSPGVFYVGLPSEDLAAEYRPDDRTLIAGGPLDFATVVMRDYSGSDDPATDVFDMHEALRMAALSSDFPIDPDDETFDFGDEPPVDSTLVGEEWFYGRAYEQRRFREMVDGLLAAADGNDASSSSLVLVYGVGGIGKTTLCARFRDIARDENPYRGRVTVIHLDWEDHATALEPDAPRYETLLSFLAEKLEATPLKRHVAPFRHLVTQVDKAEQRAAQQLRKDKENDQFSTLANLGVGAVKVLIRAALPVPVVAELLNVGVDQVPKLTALANTWVKGQLGEQDRMLLLESEQRLGLAFGASLRAAARERPIVYTLDTYETVAWAERLGKMYAQAGPRVGWVLAGRFTDDQRASFVTKWPPARLVPLPIGQLTEYEVKACLEEQAPKRELRPDQLKRIVAATAGVPLAVHLAAAMWWQGESLEAITEDDDASRADCTAPYLDIVEILANRLFKYAKGSTKRPDDYERLVGLALLSNLEQRADDVDAGLLAVLWNVDKVDEILRELGRRYEFVERRGIRLHEQVRDTLRRRMLNPAMRLDLRPANRRAIDYLESRLAEVQHHLSTLETRIANGRWCRLVLALAWHRFWDDDECGWATVLSLFPAAGLYDPLLARQLLDVAGPLFDGWGEGGPDRLRLRRLTQAVSTSIVAIGGDVSWLDERVLHITGLQPDADCKEETKAIALLWRAGAAVRSGLAEAALHHFQGVVEMAVTGGDELPLLRERCFRELEDLILGVIWPEGRFSSVRSKTGADAARLALRLQPENATMHYYLGLSLMDERSTRDVALLTLQEAARLDPSDAVIRRHLALIHLFRGDSDGALTLQSLAAESPTMHDDLAYLAIRTGDLDRALECGANAIQHNSTNSLAVARLGAIYYLSDRSDPRAEEAFRQAISLDPAKAAALYGLALSAHHKGHSADEVIAPARQAAEADSDGAVFRIGLASLLRAHDRAEEARQTFLEVLETWPALWAKPAARLDCDLLEAKALAQLALGQHAEALESLDQATSVLPTGFLPGFVSSYYGLLDENPPLDGLAEFRAVLYPAGAHQCRRPPRWGC
jgi:tetratricopeptide (TPR) repeat protein